MQMFQMTPNVVRRKMSEEVSALPNDYAFLLFLRTVDDHPTDATKDCMKIQLREAIFMQTSYKERWANDRAKPTEPL
jgi:hypothetical protein